MRDVVPYVFEFTKFRSEDLFVPENRFERVTPVILSCHDLDVVREVDEVKQGNSEAVQSWLPSFLLGPPVLGPLPHVVRDSLLPPIAGDSRQMVRNRRTQRLLKLLDCGVVVGGRSMLRLHLFGFVWREAMNDSDRPPEDGLRGFGGGGGRQRRHPRAKW